MDQYPRLKSYINCFLFENVEEVTKKFMEMLKGYRVCEFSEYSAKKDRFTNNEVQILDFFNGVIQDEPLRHTSDIITQWRNSEIHSECKFHPILPEDVIAYYTVLKETLLHFSEIAITNETQLYELKEELDSLDSEIQKTIATAFLEWQEEIHKQNG